MLEIQPTGRRGRTATGSGRRVCTTVGHCYVVMCRDIYHLRHLPPPAKDICPQTDLALNHNPNSNRNRLMVKGSPYSIAERRLSELIPVLGSQPAGGVSHKPGGRLPLQ